jgi:hypothetical protein
LKCETATGIYVGEGEGGHGNAGCGTDIGNAFNSITVGFGIFVFFIFY